MSLFNDLVRYIASFLGLLTPRYDEAVAQKGLRECQKGIKRINYALKNAQTMGEKQHLEACLRNIKTYRNQIKAMVKKGAGLSSRKETARDRVRWDDSDTAFNTRILTGVISNLKHKDPKAFLIDAKALFKIHIQNALKKDAAVKVNTTFGGEFEIVKGDSVLNEYKYFTTSNSPIYRDTDLDTWFDEKVIKPIMNELEEFQERDSGWALKRIINLGVNINKYTPQLGSSYIELPEQIKRKEACINIKNDDQACFAWAVTSALYPVTKDPQRLYKYPHFSTILKLKGIQFPMTMKQIPNFEKQNNVSINVYILQKQKSNFITLPTYLTKDKKDQHVNLLLIQDKYYEEGEEGDIQYHFVWIKNLSRLLSTQLSKEDGRKFFCDRCLHYFRSESKLNRHIEDCEKLNETAIKMPAFGQNILKFKNFKNKEKVPFIVYADLESVLKPTNDLKKPQHHIPASVGYYLKCSYDNSISFYRSYRGFDCMQWFADEMAKLAEDIATVFWCPYDIHMTPTEEAEFQKATHCHICEQPFAYDDKKVRDHFHLIPEFNYRGAAHEGCNINFQDSHTVPVVFHNLSGYDAHFIITDIATRMNGSIDLLPITKEKYISFTKHINEYPIQFRFIDSFRFMASSLDKLASYMHEFPNLKSQFPFLPLDQFNLLTKKGVMPYDYFDSFDRFNETCLPSIDSFYNKLENNPCPHRLYQRAQQVWSKFNCRDLGEYVDLYMKTDILLLADVFEQFRTTCLRTYKLDPAHYYTLPGFTWDAMLKYTKQELELLTDPDMFLFVEKGIRGGLSQVCSKRRAHANNKYIPNYDPTKPSKYLMYYDVNNQYGWAMSQYLPYGGFEWIDTNIDVMSIPDDGAEGCILEVDLEYPQHLHNHHKNIPFCPEHINPKTRKPPKTPMELTKLMATLNNKEKYVIHYRALKQAIEHGLIVTKIHRVLKFKQSPWLKSYIDLNTNLRKAAKNEFEKNLFKLMNNAIFGKSLESVRKRVNIRLLTEWSGRYGAEAYISKPEFKNCTIFNENLVAVELRKLQVYLNKPIYVGQSILDLAKTTVYDFHYRYMSSVFGDCSVLYTDTDSLIYEINNQDPYETMKRDCHLYFDTSDYPQPNIYGIPPVNKKVIGLMKDENNGVPMTDYVGLRAKLYATKVLYRNEDIIKKKKELDESGYDKNEIDDILKNIGITKKAKGVKSSVVKSVITFEDYVECLESFRSKTVSQNLIRSEKHQVHSITQRKVALSHEDDKRVLITGSDETIPWGHYSISHDPMDDESKMTLCTIPSVNPRTTRRPGRPPSGKSCSLPIRQKEMSAKVRSTYRRSLDPCDSSNDSGISFADHHMDHHHQNVGSERLTWTGERAEPKRQRLDIKLENDDINDGYCFPESVRTCKDNLSLIRTAPTSTVPSLSMSTNPNSSVGRAVPRCVPLSSRQSSSGPVPLTTQLMNSSRYIDVSLQILKQPEQQHRARYQTEGSRGAVKDREGNGFPIVQLVGYYKPSTLQVFIGTDVGKVSPHMFYQACKVSGKNSTPCLEKKIDGTCVIELQLDPSKEMSATCDCVGILKERNVDVEHRFPDQLGNRSKKKSTRCRMIFRTTITLDDGSVETLQVCSQPIVCTQPPGVPEICKKSLTSCPASGGLELFVLGKNFLKDTKVVFQQYEDGHVRWEQSVIPDKEYLQQTHFVCVVPPYRRPDITEPVGVRLCVESSGKRSESHQFVYTPVNGVPSVMVEPAPPPQPSQFFKSNFWHSSVSISKREEDLDMMPPPDSSMVPISTRRPSINLPSTSDALSPPLHGLKQEYIDETSQGSIMDQERYRHLSESSLDVHHGDSNMSMINENSMMSHINENSNISVGNEDPVCMNRVNSICESSLDCGNSSMSSINEDSTCSTSINPTTLLNEKTTTIEKVMDLRMKMPMVTVADLVNTTAPSIAALQRFGIMEHPTAPLPTQSAQSVENYLNKIEAKPSMIPMTNPTGLLMKNDISQKLSQTISTDSNVFSIQKTLNLQNCGLLNTREPVFPSITRPFMSSTTQNEVMNIVAKSESADVAEQTLPEQTRTMASSAITTVATALERSVPTPINTERLDALVNSTVESHLSPTKTNSLNLVTTATDVMIATQDVMLNSQPTLMVPPIINTTPMSSAVLGQSEIPISNNSPNLTSEVILNSQISPSLMCRNTNSIQQETLLPPAPNLSMCQPNTVVEQALMNAPSPQQSLLATPQTEIAAALTTEPEKVVLLKAAVDLLETQQRINDLGANLQSPTSQLSTTTVDTYSRSYGNLTMSGKEMVVPTTQDDKENVDRMIPQSFTSLTENELINLINPSCFDQV